MEGNPVKLIPLHSTDVKSIFNLHLGFMCHRSEYCSRSVSLKTVSYNIRRSSGMAGCEVAGPAFAAGHSGGSRVTGCGGPSNPDLCRNFSSWEA